MLRSQLKRLHLPNGASVEAGNPAFAKKVSVEQYLTTLIRQNYLDRIQIGGGPTGAAKGKRMRGAGMTKGGGDNEDGDLNYEWRWGERAHAEISEEAVCAFMVEFMTERSRPDGNAEEREEKRQERLERVEKQMERDIIRAAATPLTKIS